MSTIKSLIDRLDRIKLLHEKKNEDYASSSNPFDNFERSGEIASWFDDPTHKAFANLIGTKLARLATLLNKKTAPNNESVQDSFDDLTTYCALFGSYVESKTANSYPLDDYLRAHAGNCICSSCSAARLLLNRNSDRT